MTSSLRSRFSSSRFSSRFSRGPRRCFYLSGSRLTVYQWRRGTLTDALLFQRKASVGLLFRHILTSLQQHTLLQYLQNSYDQNGEKSSVKCEICTKLDSDPPRDLLDVILRKTNRPERLQELADA